MNGEEWCDNCGKVTFIVVMPVEIDLDSGQTATGFEIVCAKCRKPYYSADEPENAADVITLPTRISSRADKVSDGMLLPGGRNPDGSLRPPALVTQVGKCPKGWPSTWVEITTGDEDGIRVQRLPGDWGIDVYKSTIAEAA